MDVLVEEAVEEEREEDAAVDAVVVVVVLVVARVSHRQRILQVQLRITPLQQQLEAQLVLVISTNLELSARSQRPWKTRRTLC